MSEDNQGAFVGIAGAIGGLTFVMVFFTLIFAREQAASIIPSIVAPMAILGIFLGWFACCKNCKPTRRR
jgi:hypothetical protein